MDLQQDPIAIVSSACRLPLGITSPSQLWDAFCNYGDSKLAFTSADFVPDSRRIYSRTFIDPTRVGGAGWLGKEGIESFDPSFFNISPAEAEVLRPNTRLALELTWESLERAGISPSSVRGRNVAVSIGVGTEDGWDMRRFSDDKFDAFDHRWAANSDPSGVSGQVAHFFDFHGPSSVISTACSSGAFALRDGIQALLHEECELAIVGAVTTHFFTAPFDWAASVNVASKRGQCAAFSSEADGYVPSEGAVFFALKKVSIATASGNPVLGIIRSLATGHNGATRALATPNVSAQAALTRRSLRFAGISPSEVSILEAHGTGTRLGDAIETEAFRSVYDNDEFRRHPLWVSSSKTLFGHCQAASMFVGILKILSCFEHKALPPHLVEPLPEFKDGLILIPTISTPLTAEQPLVTQVCSFGFTGSIASLVLEEHIPPTALPDTVGGIANSQLYVLPFSAKTRTALDAQIASVYNWARKTECSLSDLGALLSLAREHHPVRLCVVVSDIEELRSLSSETFTLRLDYCSTQDMPRGAAFLNLSQLPSSITEEERQTVSNLLDKNMVLHAACLLYNKGHKLYFDEIYDLRNVDHLCQYLQTFPTYVFDRKTCWRNVLRAGNDVPVVVTRVDVQEPTDGIVRVNKAPSIELVAEAVASVLRIEEQDVPYDSNIFDLGIDSLNSIELAGTLSESFGISLPILELYSLLTVRAIHAFCRNKIGDKSEATRTVMPKEQATQDDIDALVAKYGAPLDTSLATATKEGRSNSALTVLLTGANGMLGCHVLEDLLHRSEVARVLCLVRGDAWDRLSSSYSTYGHDVEYLIRERDTGRLIVFHSSDLGDEHLGCDAGTYSHLEQNVDTIVHLAWRLDFNLPTSAFHKCIEGTRRLAQLCVDARKEVAYYFISSFSAYFGYNKDLIPEEPLAACASQCLNQGYALSKLVAEHALFVMNKNSNASFSLRVVRIGQICGNSVSGAWTLSEMVPMMIKSLPTLKSFPRNLPDVSWIPSDLCAAAISEFVLCSTSQRCQGCQVLHLANPRITPWRTIASALAELAGLNSVSLVSLKDYVEAIRNSSSRNDLPITRLLPYFSNVLESGDLPSKYASLEVKKSLAYSSVLASCPEVEQFLRPIITSLLGSEPVPAPPIQAFEPPVLLFGPWSESAKSTLGTSAEVKSQVTAIALETRKAIRYNDENKPLDHQLATLTCQVSAFEDFKKRNVVPRAVLGYCFGEYAASVCAGILSLETVVDIIVRRAAGLHDVKGSMLNVFADVNTVKRQLLKLPFIMEIAIYAGPQHHVLSGAPADIAAAQLSFRNADIKTKLVETSIPFHSALVDHTIMGLQLPNVQCSSGSCAYISGLTGSSIGGSRLGPKYWLRHMRDPVQFLDAVQYIQKHFPSSPLVDVGPGRMLASIIARYKWDVCQILSLEQLLSTGISRIITSPVDHSLPQRQDHALRETVLTSSSTKSPTAISAEGKMDRGQAEASVIDILISQYGFKESESRTLLSKSFLMLGLQSLDFIAFSEKVAAATGLVFPASSFTSDQSLSEILNAVIA